MKQGLGVAQKFRRTQEDRRAGVIVTAVNDDGPPLWTFHVPGSPAAALVEACARLEARGGGWKVQTISTANSIHRDLAGTRADHTERDRYVSRTTAPGTQRHEDHRPEVVQLGMIGRLDLLVPKLGAWA